MGKAALLAIVAFTLIGGYYSLSSQRGLVESVDRLSGHQYEVLARNAALAGYALARQQLADAGSFAIGEFAGTVDGASYTTQTSISGPNEGVISSRGSISSGQGRAFEYHVRAEVRREVVVEMKDEPPGFMSYALLAEGDIDLRGNAGTEVYEVIQGQASNQLNASVHSNGEIKTNGNVSVRGFGTHLNGSTHPTHRNFEPYYNPTGAAELLRVSEKVEMPQFDSAEWLSRVSEYTIAPSGADLTLSGNQVLGGTRARPVVYYVPGNLRLSGQVSAYTMFIVEGDVDLTGGVRVGTNDYSGPDESALAIYANGNLRLRGNTEVNGQVFVGGEVTSQGGTADVYGSVATLGSGELKGTPRIVYRRASPALTTIFEPGTPRLKLIAYNEW